MAKRKPPSPFERFNSSPEVIRLVVMMYVKYPLSLRNVEDLLAERGIDVSYETVRFWWNRFGPMLAAEIRRRRVDRMRAFTHWKWHLDEVYVKINGQLRYLWRAVDHEGEVLESYVTETRDKAAALAFIKKALKRNGSAKAITTDGPRSYKAAMNEIGAADRQEVGRWANNRAENSHLPIRRRERAMLRFRRMKTLQKSASVHASFHNHFNQDRHLTSRETFKANRSVAVAEWEALACSVSGVGEGCACWKQVARILAAGLHKLVSLGRGRAQRAAYALTARGAIKMNFDRQQLVAERCTRPHGSVYLNEAQLFENAAGLRILFKEG